MRDRMDVDPPQALTLRVSSVSGRTASHTPTHDSGVASGGGRETAEAQTHEQGHLPSEALEDGCPGARGELKVVEVNVRKVLVLA